MVFFWHALPVMAIGVFLAGLGLGYEKGVRDTEERWSEAVHRHTSCKE